MLCAKADTLARGWHLRKACVVCNGKFILLGNFLIFFPSSSLSCLLIFFFNRFSFSIFLSTFLVSLCFFFTCLFFPPFQSSFLSSFTLSILLSHSPFFLLSFHSCLPALVFFSLLHSFLYKLLSVSPSRSSLPVSLSDCQQPDGLFVFILCLENKV